MKEKSQMINRVSDEAVKAKTGKNWKEWFSILDKEGAKKLTHKEIVALLSKKYKVGSWWRQMVAVSYEQARGLRNVHENPQGYQISVSRTMSVPVSKLFNAWQDEKIRKKWLPENIVIRKATENKSMRITWSDQKTSLELNFYPKGDSKTQVVVQHSKLPDSKSADQKKVYWAKMLDKLQEII
jgi:uncharacterized protein YndB with AHSA1/START domain